MYYFCAFSSFSCTRYNAVYTILHFLADDKFMLPGVSGSETLFPGGLCFISLEMKAKDALPSSRFLFSHSPLFCFFPSQSTEHSLVSTNGVESSFN